MRPEKPFSRSGIVTAALLLVSAVIAFLIGCGGNDESPAPQGETVRSAVLDNSQEFPPNNSPGRGTGVVALDPRTKRISAVVITAGVDNVTEVHLHVGAPGNPVGAVILGLARLDNAADVWTAQDNTAATDNVVAFFNQGSLCFNVHTTQSPSGEIRGQVLSQAVPILTATLSSSKEVPPDAGTPFGGRGVFGLVKAASKLMVGAVLIPAPISPLSVHVHAGNPGINGESVLIDNLAPIAGTGVWTTLPGTVLSDNAAALLQAGGLYVHAHTAAHPAGEVRGQIGDRPASSFSIP